MKKILLLTLVFLNLNCTKIKYQDWLQEKLKTDANERMIELYNHRSDVIDKEVKKYLFITFLIIYNSVLKFSQHSCDTLEWTCYNYVLAGCINKLFYSNIGNHLLFEQSIRPRREYKRKEDRFIKKQSSYIGNLLSGQRN